MKTLSSVPFGAMSGSAGAVTARSTRFGTILSGHCHQSGRVTPNQKNSRALFARVGRSYTRLTVEQAEAWAAFAAAYAFGSRMRTKSAAAAGAGGCGVYSGTEFCGCYQGLYGQAYGEA